MKLRGKAKLLTCLAEKAIYPQEVIVLAALINRALDTGALTFQHGEAVALGETFTKYGNRLLREAKSVDSIKSGLVAPDGSKL